METKMIGNKIAKARKDINMSQAQLAQQLFISPQAVGKWERGESIPDLITFNRLAEILGVDLNYFSENYSSVAAGTKDTPAPAMQSASSDSPKLSSEKQENKRSWDMSRGNWVDADFSGLKNLHEKFGSSNMQRCLFMGSDLSGLLLKSNNVDSCDFSGSDISSSHIRHSNLLNNQFKNCSLREAEFSGSYITGCDFSDADFTGATFKSGGIEKNQMSGAIFHRTAFNGMHIADTVFEGSLEDCSFENCKFTRVTFQNATLTNTFFKDNNLKRIRFVDCRADNLTYAFLKNGKADLAGLELIIS